MSEEIRKQNPELSDATLEGVSGGVSDTLVRNTEKQFCVCYSHKPPNTCKGDARKLAEYRAKYGVSSVWTWADCPFLPDA